METFPESPAQQPIQVRLLNTKDPSRTGEGHRGGGDEDRLEEGLLVSQ